MENLLDTVKKQVIVVAEIGKNFIQTEEEQGASADLEEAKRLVRGAKEAGADAVKFQTHMAEDEVLSIEFDSPHFKGKSRYAWVSRNEQATPVEEFWKPLKQYCDEIGVVFFSTPMSRGAAMKLQHIGVPFWKVASSDILDYVMLDFMAKTGKPVIIPSGMSTLEDIDESLRFLKSKGMSFILMHAISRYPYPPEDSNLATISFFQKRYPDTVIGFSQNSPWVEPAIAAVAMGARMVEQHFTFDRGAWGPDHKVSMVPDEFARMAQGIRRVERDSEAARAYLTQESVKQYMGSETKFLQEGEVAFRSLFRKSLMAGQDIPTGTIITSEMVYAMRPQQFAGGLPSEKYETTLGKRTTRPLKKFDPIIESAYTLT